MSSSNNNGANIIRGRGRGRCRDTIIDQLRKIDNEEENMVQEFNDDIYLNDSDSDVFSLNEQSNEGSIERNEKKDLYVLAPKNFPKGLFKFFLNISE